MESKMNREQTGRPEGIQVCEFSEQSGMLFGDQNVWIKM